MVMVSNMDNEEEKQNQQNPSASPIAPSGGGGAVRLAPSSAVAPVGGNASNTPGAAPTPGAGGQFASLNQYVTANQGQAQPLADKLSEGINKEYSNLDTANNTAIAGINNQVTNAPGYTPNNPDVLAKEAANPVSFAGDQGNVKQFQSLLNNSYGGPLTAEGTSDYQKQQAAVNNAIAAGQQQTTTEAGRKQLLAQNEATPTSGVTSLNSAILSQSPEALGQVETAYQPFQNLLTNLSTGAQGVDQTIAKEQADAAASAKAANDAITSQINALNTGVGGEVTAAQNAAANQAATLKADLAAGTPTPADLAALGMTSDQWNALSAADKAAATSQVITAPNGQGGVNTGTTNIDLTQFLTSQNPNLALTAANVATPADYQKAQAFQTLLNGLNLGTPATTISPTTAAQAGTAPTNLNTFDYQTALNTAQTAKASEIAAAQAYEDAIQAGNDEAHAQAVAKQAAEHAAAYGIGALASGVVLPSAAGVAEGTVNSLKNDISNPSLKHTADIVNSILGPKMVVNAARGVEQGIAGAVNTISNIFCFHPDTLVEMADGSLKRICRVDIGDNTRGGKVLAITRGVGHDFYWYEGVIVTAKHAVKEDGLWIRVEQSRKAYPFKYLTEVVCNLVTDRHRIWANGIEFADERETDKYESLNLDESLAEMNKYESLG